MSEEIKLLKQILKNQIKIMSAQTDAASALEAIVTRLQAIDAAVKALVAAAANAGSLDPALSQAITDVTTATTQLETDDH